MPAGRRGRRARTVALVAMAATLPLACLEATQITVDLRSDLACARFGTVGIVVGSVPLDEDAAPNAELQGSAPDPGTFVDTDAGCRLGTLVLTPSGAGTSVGLRVHASLTDQSTIVARRRTAYLKHAKSELPITLRSSCADVACKPEETCEDGVCVGSVVGGGCTAPGGCEDAGIIAPPPPPPPPPPDAGGPPPACATMGVRYGWTFEGTPPNGPAAEIGNNAVSGPFPAGVVSGPTMLPSPCGGQVLRLIPTAGPLGLGMLPQPLVGAYWISMHVRANLADGRLIRVQAGPLMWDLNLVTNPTAGKLGSITLRSCVVGMTTTCSPADPTGLSLPLGAWARVAAHVVNGVVTALVLDQRQVQIGWMGGTPVEGATQIFVGRVANTFDGEIDDILVY